MGFTNWLKNVFGIEEQKAATEAQPSSTAKAEAVAAPPVSLPMDDEEKTLVAVMAACIAGKESPDAQLHISRITRIQ